MYESAVRALAHIQCSSALKAQNKEAGQLELFLDIYSRLVESMDSDKTVLWLGNSHILQWSRKLLYVGGAAAKGIHFVWCCTTAMEVKY